MPARLYKKGVVGCFYTQNQILKKKYGGKKS